MLWGTTDEQIASRYGWALIPILLFGAIMFFRDLSKKNSNIQNTLPMGSTLPPVPSALKYLLLMFIAGTVFNLFIVFFIYQLCEVKESFIEYLPSCWPVILGIYVLSFIGGMIMYGLMRKVRP